MSETITVLSERGLLHYPSPYPGPITSWCGRKASEPEWQTQTRPIDWAGTWCTACQQAMAASRQGDAAQILDEIAAEFQRATSLFPKFNSPHEGWAVIREEIDELWECVKVNAGRSPSARAETIQAAAMCLRYIVDIIDGPAAKRGVRCDNHDQVDCPICLAWAAEGTR